MKTRLKLFSGLVAAPLMACGAVVGAVGSAHADDIASSPGALRQDADAPFLTGIEVLGVAKVKADGTFTRKDGLIDKLEKKETGKYCVHLTQPVAAGAYAVATPDTDAAWKSEVYADAGPAKVCADAKNWVLVDTGVDGVYKDVGFTVAVIAPVAPKES
ncbi:MULTISPECIES: hypothetical protein [unclassified Streptomyces]|uniref:Uncharacterized protein n=1 Tax=Streptomyces sp. NBC_00060 TaxID=2975636 RepID=A0AAU2GSV2_9ACTN